MQKQAPSVGRILVAVGFTLSCFGLLLFLWVTFGGSIPFKPQSYRFTADFPEAITLQKQADVRIGGVSVGKVVDLSLAPDSECHQDPTTCNTTRATIQIDPQYAPISSDARATLRQKTLLGETYIELTPGSQNADQAGHDVSSVINSPRAIAQASTIDVGQVSGSDAPHPVPEGGHLAQTQVQNQTQIDEIFQGFDRPTRQAFQSWMQNAGIAINGRGLDLNDALGNLGPFANDTSDVLGTLRQQETSLRTLVHDTGDVFGALTAHNQALAGAIRGSNETFGALASQSKALSDTFKIFPTFENEGRLTLNRLKGFAQDARPVFHDLRPVARNLSPTLRDLRTLAPQATTLFKNYNPWIDAARTGFPSLSSFIRELRPLTDGLQPFLDNFNPLVRWIDYQAPVVNDFLGNIPAATAGFLPTQSGQSAPLHISRQMTIFTSESLSVYPQRLATNRGNGYLQPFAIGSFFPTTQGEIFPSHDCNNTSNFPGGGAVTGGLGSGQVTRDPASSPPASESGEFPLSSIVNPLNPSFISPNPNTDANPLPPGGPSAFAPCTIAPNFPSAFGGGKVPQVLPDPG